MAFLMANNMEFGVDIFTTVFIYYVTFQCGVCSKLQFLSENICDYGQ